MDSHNQHSGSRLIAGLYCGLCLIGFGCTGAGTIGTGILFIATSLNLSGFSLCLFPTSIILGYTSWLLLKGCMHFGAEFIFGPDKTMTFSDGFKINPPTQDTSPLIPLPGAIQQLRDIKQEQIRQVPSAIIFWKPKINPLEEVAKVPLPEHWKNILGKNSSLYRRLPEHLKPKLHQLINLFLCEIDFEPYEEENFPLEITEEMRVRIAGEACLLILNVKTNAIECFNHYEKMERVTISRCGLDKGRAAGLGGPDQVWIVWQWSEEGMTTSSDNGSIIIHEFAHTLDHTPDNEWGGVPLKEDSPQYKPWKRWLKELYEKAENMEIKGRDILIKDEDGTKNPTEFFAAATEVYFDQPKELKKNVPEVYHKLNSFYKLDTHNWPEEEIVEVPPVIIDPIPDTVPGILHEQVALYRLLPPDEKRKLIKLAREFLKEYAFEGRDGLTVTEPMKIAFAGQACILKLNHEYRIFTPIKRIILHPDKFTIDGVEYGACLTLDGIEYEAYMNDRTYHNDLEKKEIHFSWKVITDHINRLQATTQPILLGLAPRLALEQDWYPLKSRFENCMKEYQDRYEKKSLYRWETMNSMNMNDFIRDFTVSFFCQPYSMQKDVPDLYEAFIQYYGCWPLYWVEQRQRELAAKPFPDEWQKILQRNVKHYSRLPSDLCSKLHGLIHIFLDEIQFEAKGEAEITDQNRICVAAEACILILNRSPHDYRRIERVEIWKDMPEGNENWAGSATTKFVTLNWKSTQYGMSVEDDNYNITMHEFAHVLDNVDDNTTQSVPVPENSPNRKMWEELVDREYPILEEAYKSGRGHVIREYGLHTYGEEKRRAEFFTCATEAFFERSTRLKKECPSIYTALRSFYQLDPANWDVPT